LYTNPPARLLISQTFFNPEAGLYFLIHEQLIQVTAKKTCIKQL